MTVSGDFKIAIAIVWVSVFICTPSLFSSTSINEVLGRGSNSSVLVENRVMSPENLLCDTGIHPDAKGICPDGSHPLVTRANPIPTTEKSVNYTKPATINLVSLCADHTIANSTTDKCHDGSQPLQLDIEDLTCTNGNRPLLNGTCADGSLPQILNKTKTDVSVNSN